MILEQLEMQTNELASLHVKGKTKTYFSGRKFGKLCDWVKQESLDTIH